MVHSHGLYSMINKPTSINNHYVTLMDNTLTNVAFNDDKFYASINTICDNLLIFVIVIYNIWTA